MYFYLNNNDIVFKVCNVNCVLMARMTVSRILFGVYCGYSIQWWKKIEVSMIFSSVLFVGKFVLLIISNRDIRGSTLFFNRVQSGFWKKVSIELIHGQEFWN